MSQLTVSAARRLFGSNYHIALLCGVNRSTVGRWGRMVPDRYAEVLAALPPKRLKSGRPTGKAP